MARIETLDLFGGSRPWSPLDWRSTDDRVRGGNSQSYMQCSPANPIARFHGNLDIDTLGGAGFASQQTSGDDRSWDLSEYDGIVLEIERADAKTYTFNLKDEILGRDPDSGKRQSSVSWEFDFNIDKEQSEHGFETEYVYIQWGMLLPTYRGKEKKDAGPLKKDKIRRMSLMMRSFFGDQKGDFSLSIRSISAYKLSKKGKVRTKSVENAFPYPFRDDPNAALDIDQPRLLQPEFLNEKATVSTTTNEKPAGFFGWLYGACTDCVRFR